MSTSPESEVNGPRPGRRRGYRRVLKKGLIYTVPLTLLMVVCFNIPVLALIVRSFDADGKSGFANYTRIAESSVYLGVLRSTLRVAALTTLVCVLVGYPTAYWISHLEGKYRSLAIALVVLPFWVSVLVRTYAWIIVLGFNGAVNKSLIELGIVGSPIQLIYNTAGVVVGMTHVLIPFVVLPLVATMTRIDGRYERAAASLGGTPGRVFATVYFPFTLPSLATGSALVFILSLGFFVTPAILGGGNVSMVATVLDTLVNRLPEWELAAALAVVVLLIGSAIYSLSRCVTRIYR